MRSLSGRSSLEAVRLTGHGCFMLLRVLATAWWSSMGGAVQATTTTSATDAHHPVLVWVSEQPGAHVPLDKIEYRNGGIYAKQFIPKGEVFLVIPTNALFLHDNVPLDWQDEWMADPEEDNVSLDCVTAWLVVQEYEKILLHQEKGDGTDPSGASRFAPYLKFVMEEFRHEYLPLNWSRPAVDIFKNLILGPQLEPQHFGLPDYRDQNGAPVGLYLQKCHSFYNKYQHHHNQRYPNVDAATFLQRLDAALRVVEARGWYHVLVPIFDMFNHRNSGVRTPEGVQHSDWHNVDRLPVTTKDNKGRTKQRRASVLEEYRIVALRDIEAGEGLYNSYNQCHDVTCPTSIAETYITPHVFADYGFVEQYPQRWRFDSDESGDWIHDIVFELDEKKKPATSNRTIVNDDPSLPPSKPELVLTWLSTSIIPVDMERRNVLYNHWKRLVELEPTLEQETQSMLAAAATTGTDAVQAHQEVSLIWDYYHALTTAFEQAVIAAAAAAKAKRSQVELEDEADEWQLLERLATFQEDEVLDDGIETCDAQLGATETVVDSVDADDDLKQELQDRVMARTGRQVKVTTKQTATTDPDSQAKQCQAPSSRRRPRRVYDTLQNDRPDWLNYQFSVTDRGCNWPDFNWTPVFDHEEDTPGDDSSSRLSRLHFDHYYNPKLHVWNSCLQINEWLQSCTNFRPHYHEMVVHYPAQYIAATGAPVKRVAFLGGGDIMIMHEILKFPQLEFVLGMELDMQVVRTSFRNSGIQPKFEHPAVHWAFGDATKSLLMIPPSWYHTFDLVVVDLQNFVFDTVLVTPEWTIMDFVAQKLVAPHGVVSRNDDFVRRRGNLNFAQHVVDVELHDVPRLCQQSLTMGSNGIDFLQVLHPAKPHATDMVFFDPLRHNSSLWTNYRYHNARQASSSTPTTTTASSELKDNNATNVKDDEMVSFGPPHGILFTLEVENTTVPLGISTLVRANVRHALQDMGLVFETMKDTAWLEEHSATLASAEAASIVVNRRSTELKGSTIVFVLPQTGHVTVRTFPRFNYCGIDVLLWNHFQDQYKILEALVLAVGGQWNSTTTSFYSTVATAPYGLNQPNTSVSRPEAPEQLEKESAERKKDLTSEKAPKAMATPTPETNWEARVLVELTTTLSPNATAGQYGGEPASVIWVVVCGNPSETCHSLQTLEEKAAAQQTHIKVVPLRPCPSLGTDSHNRIQTMAQCELHSRKVLREATAITTADATPSANTHYKKKNKKIAALILDETMPYEMGQVLHKILNSTQTRLELLGHSFLMLSRISEAAPDTSSTSSASFSSTSSSSWGSILLERIRTEMVQFNPLFHSELLISEQVHDNSSSATGLNNNKDGSPRTMSMGILSVGDYEFYHHLSIGLALIQENGWLKAQVLGSQAGIVSYLPDFALSKRVTTDDYDWTDAKTQWHSQMRLAHQSLYRFEIQLPLPPLSTGDEVLVNAEEHVWYGVWFSGQVTAVHPDGTYQVRYMDGRKNRSMPRRLLRKLDQNTEDPNYKFGDRVLLHLQNFEGYPDVWMQASITGRISTAAATSKDGAAAVEDRLSNSLYQVQIFTDGVAEQVAAPSDMIFQLEPADTNVHSEITLDKLETLMTQKIIPTIASHHNDDDTIKDLLEYYHVTKVGSDDDVANQGGYVLSFLWAPVESLIVVWDGQKRLDVNLFTTDGQKEDAFRSTLEGLFLAALDYLVTISVDEQPRGIGRIVNTAQEKQAFWFGQLDEYRDAVLAQTQRNHGRVPKEEYIDFTFGPSLASIAKKTTTTTDKSDDTENDHDDIDSEDNDDDDNV